jgi:hypothetical protein
MQRWRMPKIADCVAEGVCFFSPSPKMWPEQREQHVLELSGGLAIPFAELAVVTSNGVIGKRKGQRIIGIGWYHSIARKPLWQKGFPLTAGNAGLLSDDTD